MVHFHAFFVIIDSPLFAATSAKTIVELSASMLRTAVSLNGGAALFELTRLSVTGRDHLVGAGLRPR